MMPAHCGAPSLVHPDEIVVYGRVVGHVGHAAHAAKLFLNRLRQRRLLITGLLKDLADAPAAGAASGVVPDGLKQILTRWFQVQSRSTDCGDER